MHFQMCIIVIIIIIIIIIIVVVIIIINIIIIIKTRRGLLTVHCACLRFASKVPGNVWLYKTTPTVDLKGSR